MGTLPSCVFLMKFFICFDILCILYFMLLFTLFLLNKFRLLYKNFDSLSNKNIMIGAQFSVGKIRRRMEELSQNL